jgi:hypothetical protein
MMNPVESPYADIIVQNLQYQGSSNDCGPYTTATVVNAMRGKNLEGDELAKVMNKPRLRGIKPIIRRVPNWATFPWGMVDVFREHKLWGRWWFRVPLPYLKPALNAGHILMPIIGEWQPKSWAHVMTLVAWNPEKGWGFANTQSSRNEIRWRSEKDFIEKWNNYARLLVEIEKPELKSIKRFPKLKAN